MSYSQSQRPIGPIDFAVLGESFTLLFNRWKEYLVMGLVSCALPALAVIIYFALIFSVAFSNPSTLDETTMIVMQLLGYPVILGSMFAVMPCLGGITVFTLKVVRTGDADLSDFWGEWQCAGRWYTLGLLFFMWYFLGTLACGLGAIVATALLFFAMPIMAHENVSPSEAIKESYERLKDQFWPVLGLAIIANILSQIGATACYVGYLFTFPLYMMIPAMAYAKWLAPLQRAESASPYPRGKSDGYGAPPQQNIGDAVQSPPPSEETPGPRWDEPPTD